MWKKHCAEKNPSKEFSTKDTYSYWKTRSIHRNLAVQPNEGRELYSKMLSALHNNDLNKKNVWQRLLQASEQGRAWAHVILYEVYRTGFFGADYDEGKKTLYKERIRQNIKVYERWCLSGRPDGQNIFAYVASVLKDYKTQDLRLSLYTKDALSREGLMFVNIKKASEANYYRASTNLGICYTHGLGASVDAQKAREAFEKASLAGDSIARYKLGFCALSEGDFDEAFSCFESSAGMGYPLACNLVAEWYEKGGYGVNQNHKNAFKYYDKGAQEKYRFSQYNLGRCYHRGIGCSKNYNKAWEYYDAAVRQESSGEFREALHLLLEDSSGDRRNKKAHQKCHDSIAAFSRKEVLATSGLSEVKLSRFKEAVADEEDKNDSKEEAPSSRRFGVGRAFVSGVGLYSQRNLNKVLPTAEDLRPGPRSQTMYEQFFDEPLQPPSYEESEARRVSDEAKLKVLLKNHALRRVHPKYCCPLSHYIMWDPVMTLAGATYERAAIEEWLKRNNVDPSTQKGLPDKILTPNNSLRVLIRECLTQYASNSELSRDQQRYQRQSLSVGN